MTGCSRWGTLLMQESHERWLVRKVGGVPLDELDEALLEELAADRAGERPNTRISPRTMAKRLTTLRSALKLACRRKHLAVVPEFPEIRGPAKPRKYFLTSYAPLVRLLASIPVHRAEWVSLCFWTTQHASDVERMTWADVKLATVGKPSAFLLRNTKNKRVGRWVKMPEPLAEVLRARRARVSPLPSVRVVESWPGRCKMLPIYCVRQGLPPMQAIDFRHSGISFMVRRRGLTRAAQEWGGWSSFTMMERHYAHALPAGLTEASDELASIVDEYSEGEGGGEPAD